MGWKNIEDKQAYQKVWYLKNKQKVLRDVKERSKVYIQRNIQFVRELKESTPCTDCGRFYPFYVMDFDHIEEKKYEIARIQRESRSLEVIKKEISKCELVCSNCHRMRTWNRNNEGT